METAICWERSPSVVAAGQLMVKSSVVPTSPPHTHTRIPSPPPKRCMR